jgi:hypothetical protein
MSAALRVAIVEATRWRLEPLHNLVTSARRAPDNADFVGIKTYLVDFGAKCNEFMRTGFARLCHAFEALKKRPFRLRFKEAGNSLLASFTVMIADNYLAPRVPPSKCQP